MARKTIYNNIVGEDYKDVCQENKELLDEFLEYLQAVGKSKNTIYSYKKDTEIFFSWNLRKNKNKVFYDINKKDIMRYQNYLLTDLQHSPNRVRRLKSTLSSISNYIENILDEEYPEFRNIINKVEHPAPQLVREKLLLTDEQVDYLLAYLVEHEMYQHACVFSLGISSGSRKAELLRFKESYFTDSNIIYGSLYKTPEKIKTKGRGRGKFIYKYTLVSKFKPYFDLWIKEKKRLNIEGDELFWSNYGGIWSPADITLLDSYSITFSKILGINFYWHSVRNYHCTNLCRNNIPMDIVKDLFGWDSVEMVSLYNLSSVDEELGNYFDENGIKTIENRNFKDL